MKSYCREHVTVGIVGGGIAGLSLAKMLEMAGISYFVWEAHGKFAPSVGASLGLTPNGLRILDQLGVVEQISQVAVPHQKWEHRDGNGNLRAILTAIGCYPKLYGCSLFRNVNWASIDISENQYRLGYESFFTERQRVLQALYDSIEDKSRLQANKQVVAVKQTHEGATILARDGTEAACEIIAGADGVRSVIRHEILKRETMPENATLRQ